jgi:hypothetical protein
LIRLFGGLLSMVGAGIGALPPAHAAERPVEVGLSMTPVAAINPHLFGVNYVWHLVSDDEYPRFSAAMQDLTHARLMRYPGGWAAEWYDWESNREVEGNMRPERPGVDPETFLALAPEASFVVPSAHAIRDASQIGTDVATAVTLVRRFGNRVKRWEIGNEWWLQRGAKNDPAMRERNLVAYAGLVAAVAPAMRAANPAIEIYATGDWTEPQDFATLRRLVGARAWAAVGGLSIHPYCGTLEAGTLCSLLPERIAAIRTQGGKEKIYASEWSLGLAINRDNFGIRNANQLVAAVQDLAFARIDAAAYWPPVKAVPAFAFVSASYDQLFATGYLFGWMSRYYRGQALSTTGPLPAAAARSGDEVTLFVPSMNNGRLTVRIPLGGTGLSRVVSAEVMVAADTVDHDRARIVHIAPLPTTLGYRPDGAADVAFDLNPGTPDRGKAWEIARITLR